MGPKDETLAPEVEVETFEAVRITGAIDDEDAIRAWLRSQGMRILHRVAIPPKYPPNYLMNRWRVVFEVRKDDQQ